MGKHEVKVRYAKKLKAFGANLKKLREKKGFTQEDLAYQAGISFNSVNTLENGKLNPTVATVFAIADALGVSFKELFDI